MQATPHATTAPKSAEQSTTIETIRQANLAKFQPADEIEVHLVEQMINAQWRQHCLAIIEDSAYQQILASSNPALAFEGKSKCLASLERARKAYALEFNRALAALLKLRKAFTAKPQPTAKRPSLPTEPPPQPQPSEPYAAFSVSSTDDNAVRFQPHLE